MRRRPRLALVVALVLVASLAPTIGVGAASGEDVSKADVMAIVDRGADVSAQEAATVYDYVETHDLGNLTDGEARALYRWTLERAATERIPEPVIDRVTARVEPAAAERIATDVTSDLDSERAHRVLAAVEESGAAWTSEIEASIEDAPTVVEVEAANTTPTHEPGEWTLDELRTDGTHYEGAPPSMRWLGSYGSVTVRHTPVTPGNQGWQYLDTSKTLNGDEITLRSVRLAPSDELDTTLNVTVIAADPETKPVTVGNTTRQEPVATNVTVTTHQIELGRGYDNATIPLPSHFDEEHRVLVVVEEYPDARWSFTHKTIESQQAPPFPYSWSGYWSYTTKTILVEILVAVGLVAMGVPASLRRTGRGPNKGLLFWSIMLAIGAAILVGGAYLFTTKLLTTVPYLVVPFVIAGIVGIVMLETMEYGVYRVVFLRLFTDEGQNPRGELAAQANGAEFAAVTLAHTDNGPVAITDGLRPWLARLWCGGAAVHGLDELDNEFSLSAPRLSIVRGTADKLIFVDDEADALLEYEREHLSFELPLTEQLGEDEHRFNWAGAASIAFYGGLGAALGYLGLQALDVTSTAGAVVTAALAVGVVFTHARDGRLSFRPGVGHQQDAAATAMYYESELDEYRSLETVLNELLKERASEDELVEKLDELDEENIIKQAHDGDVSPDTFADRAPEGEPAGGDD